MLARILQIGIPFLWLGFVCAISFMEAPLKFQAPNITIPLGLEIGYLVFHTLNKIEIVLCIALLVSIFVVKPKGKFSYIAFVIIMLILLIQTFVLFPLLDERTAKVIAGKIEPFSNLHIVYIAFDSIKVLLLMALGINLTKQNLKT